MDSDAWRPLDPVDDDQGAHELDGAVGCRF